MDNQIETTKKYIDYKFRQLENGDNFGDLLYLNIYDLEVISKELEKQIPKETVEFSDESLPCCPVCEQVAVGNYCWNCGQKLVWSEE